MAEKRVATRDGVFGKSAGIQNAFVAATFVLMFFSVVLPNSAQIITAVLMIACFLLSLPIVKIHRDLVQLGFFYLGGVAVTLFYMIVGLHHGAPLIAVEQVSIVYVVSPLLWIFIAAGLMQTIGVGRLIRWFALFSISGCLSIVLFFCLFLYFGPDAVSFFKKDAVLDIGNGYVAATMFVYGSLIFICGGFFSSPKLIGGRIKQALLLVLLLVAALTSGRSALMLSIPVGMALGWLCPDGPNIPRADSLKKRRNSNLAIWVFAIGAIFGFLYVAHVDILHTLKLFVDKLVSAGGEARSAQTAALFDASVEAYGAGYGHGVGTSYVRNDEYPWRYESVWMATIFRVGVLGALIYLLPFIWYVLRTIRSAKAGELLPSQKFMFSGFVCAFLAANTNPYIESFAFQWMYVLPVVSSLAISTGEKMRPGEKY